VATSLHELLGHPLLVKRPVETSPSVHVLPIFSLRLDSRGASYVALDLLVLRRVEPDRKTHRRHGLRLRHSRRYCRPSLRLLVLLLLLPIALLLGSLRALAERHALSAAVMAAGSRPAPASVFPPVIPVATPTTAAVPAAASATVSASAAPVS
jgi:hypothetical protein